MATAAWRRQAAAFARRYVRQYTRSPLSLAFLVAWPAGWYVLLAHVVLGALGGDADGLAVAKATYAVSFGLFGAFSVSLTGVVGSFTADVSTKRYRKFRSLPVAPSADLIGRVAAGAGLSAVSYGALLAIGVLDGAGFALRSPASPLVVAGSLLAFAAVGVVVALAVATAVPRPEYATALATAVLLLVFFGTGLNGAAPRLFPGPGRWLNVVPVTLVTRLQLAHLVAGAGGPSTGFVPPPLPTGGAALALVAAYGVGSLAAGALVLDRLVYAGEVGE